VIRRFRHKGLARFFASGVLSGIQPQHAGKLRLILALLDSATGPRDLALPGLRLHMLKGEQEGTLGGVSER
jgi:proteic killer suppression protein